VKVVSGDAKVSGVSIVLLAGRVSHPAGRSVPCLSGGRSCSGPKGPAPPRRPQSRGRWTEKSGTGAEEFVDVASASSDWERPGRWRLSFPASSASCRHLLHHLSAKIRRPDRKSNFSIALSQEHRKPSGHAAPTSPGPACGLTDGRAVGTRRGSLITKCARQPLFDADYQPGTLSFQMPIDPWSPDGHSVLAERESLELWHSEDRLRAPRSRVEEQGQDPKSR